MRRKKKLNKFYDYFPSPLLMHFQLRKLYEHSISHSVCPCHHEGSSANKTMVTDSRRPSDGWELQWGLCGFNTWWLWSKVRAIGSPETLFAPWSLTHCALDRTLFWRQCTDTSSYNTYEKDMKVKITDWNMNEKNKSSGKRVASYLRSSWALTSCAHLSWVREPVPGGPVLPLCSDLMRCRCTVMPGKW